MTAPSAPVITVRSDGSKVRVRFPLVAGATTYNIYSGPSTAPTTAEVTGATGSDVTFIPADADAYIRATAVNAGAEESAYSNEVRVQTTGPGHRHTVSDPYGAYDRRD